jgi:hypothetical protein
MRKIREENSRMSCVLILLLNGACLPNRWKLRKEFQPIIIKRLLHRHH